MVSEQFVILFLILCGAGISLSLISPSAWQGRILKYSGCLAAITLVTAGLTALLANETFRQPLWSLPEMGTLMLGLDRLSAVFVIITGLIIFPASIFAGEELQRDLKLYHGRSFTVLLLLLYIFIVLIFVAGDALLFLLVWETMSILSYLLLFSERHRHKEHVSAGYLMIAMGEAGMMAVVLGFLILAVHAGTFDFTAFKLSKMGNGTRWVVFLLTFFGFGVKAGLVPVNSWLPRAYTVAPRAFVPVLAGVMLNLGLYGILRVNVDLFPPVGPGPGLVVLITGTLSALLGILYATTENDLRTMLAFSSVENAGIVVAGFGAGMVFVSTRHPVLAAIAFVAALYHMVNHSVYKTLLYIGAGTVEAQTGTCDMDRLGGLIKKMPLTAVFVLIGVLSIAALPPFNGFVSEWLTLQSMLRSAELSSVSVKLVFALCGAGLALTAALAVTCFVKMFAMSFLGMRRLDGKRQISEAGPGSLVPMAFLGILCLAFGVLPTYMIPALDLATGPLAGASAVDALVPPFFSSSPSHGALPPAFMADFHDLGAQVGQAILPGRGLVVLHRGGTDNPVVFAMSTFYMLVVLVLLLLITYGIVRCLTRYRTVTRRERWDGGVRRLLPEMTYTATGFSNPVRVVFDAVFRPATVEDTKETVAEHFRTAIRRTKQRVYLVDKIVSRPVKSFSLVLARYLAVMHDGRINVYAAYVLVALLLTLIVGLVF